MSFSDLLSYHVFLIQQTTKFYIIYQREFSDPPIDKRVVIDWTLYKERV